MIREWEQIRCLPEAQMNAIPPIGCLYFKRVGVTSKSRMLRGSGFVQAWTSESARSVILLFCLSTGAVQHFAIARGGKFLLLLLNEQPMPVNPLKLSLFKCYSFSTPDLTNGFLPKDIFFNLIKLLEGSCPQRYLFMMKQCPCLVKLQAKPMAFHVRLLHQGQRESTYAHLTSLSVTGGMNLLTWQQWKRASLPKVSIWFLHIL